MLDDTKPDERFMGIEAGIAWREVADLSVFYIDRGMSPGMNAARIKAHQAGWRYEFRSLDPYREDQLRSDPDAMVCSNGKVTTVKLRLDTKEPEAAMAAPGLRRHRPF